MDYIPENIKWVATTPKAPWKEIVHTEKTLTGDYIEITDKMQQRIDGFGGCFNELGWIAMKKLSEESCRKVLDLLFDPAKGCRFNFCRLPIGANDYATQWYSHNEVEGDYKMKHFSIERDEKCLLPYIREGLKRRPDMKLFASPWSPPVWMKFPPAYNFGKLIKTHENLSAYALYLKKFLEAYKQKGIHINQIHIQNEPISSQKFPSCIWTGEELKVFIRDYLGPLFLNEGIDTEIWLGTINGPEEGENMLYTDYDDYTDLVLSDPEARKYISGVGFQWAGKNSIQRTYESWPELKLMQTENECGDGLNTWEYAQYVFKLLRHYINNGVTSYIYWNMVLQPGGQSTWGWNQNCMITIDNGHFLLNPEFYVMKHFSHFIDPGAVVLKTKGHLTGNCLAFLNPDGKIVAVVQNPQERPRTFMIRNGGNEFSGKLEPLSINTLVFS